MLIGGLGYPTISFLKVMTDFIILTLWLSFISWDYSQNFEV